MLMLPILPASQIPPRFYRVHFLTALGLLVVVALFTGDMADSVAAVSFWLILATSGLACVIGSIVWHLDKEPGGRFIVWMTPVFLLSCLSLQRGLEMGWNLFMLDDVLSACVLGSAMTAMLMGHSYLIAPAMSMAPLMRLLACLGTAVLLRIILACYGLWTWTQIGSEAPGTDVTFWLPVRWALGLIAPLVLGWLAWETARIRSTQSATGILYVVVLMVFLGELTSMLLLERTQFIL